MQLLVCMEHTEMLSQGHPQIPNPLLPPPRVRSAGRHHHALLCYFLFVSLLLLAFILGLFVVRLFILGRIETESHFVAQTGLELTAILLPEPTCWDHRPEPPHPASGFCSCPSQQGTHDPRLENQPNKDRALAGKPVATDPGEEPRLWNPSPSRT